MMIKYPIHKVAKDFKKGSKELPSKEVMDILTQYGHPPKNHMQPLTDQELSIVFEYLTQHNQIDSIESVYADVYHDAKPAPKQAAPAGKQPQQAKAAPAQQHGQNQGNHNNAQAQTHNKGQQQAPAAKQTQTVTQPTSSIPAKKVVDTRGGGSVNLDKYDERLESFTSEKTQDRGGKQKFQGRNAQRQRGGRQAGNFGNKRRQEEQDRLRRLQLEIAKKAPVKVMIPDEISVGELASRMKKTGAEVVKCLIKNGVMASLSDVIDYDTAAIIAEEMGCKVEKEVVVTSAYRQNTSRTHRAFRLFSVFGSVGSLYCCKRASYSTPTSSPAWRETFSSCLMASLPVFTRKSSLEQSAARSARVSTSGSPLGKFMSWTSKVWKLHTTIHRGCSDWGR